MVTSAARAPWPMVPCGELSNLDVMNSICVISPTYADRSIQAEGLYSEAGQEAYQKEEDPVWTLLCRCSPKECGQARPPGCEPWI